MATLKALYSAEIAIICGIDALATSATVARASTAIDNTANLYLDALVSIKLQSVNSSLGSNPTVFIYAYGWSVGQGTDYTDNVTGTDAAYTLPSPTNLKLIGSVPYTAAQNVTMYAGPFSVALAFGGILPAKWGVVVNQQIGVALSGSAGQQVNNSLSYVALQLQSV